MATEEIKCKKRKPSPQKIARLQARIDDLKTRLASMERELLCLKGILDD